MCFFGSECYVYRVLKSHSNEDVIHHYLGLCAFGWIVICVFFLLYNLHQTSCNLWSFLFSFLSISIVLPLPFAWIYGWCFVLLDWCLLYCEWMLYPESYLRVFGYFRSRLLCGILLCCFGPICINFGCCTAYWAVNVWLFPCLFFWGTT